MLDLLFNNINFWRLVNPEQFSGSILTTHHSYWLCLFAVFLAIISAGILLPVTDRYQASKGRLKNRWLWAGSSAMGLGIWAMHFTAMLSFHIDGIKIEYNLLITIISVIPAILASACCVLLSNISKHSPKYLHLNALVMALGIGSMHYIGMEAIISDAQMYYEPKFFILSILAAYLLALLALYTHITLIKKPKISKKIEALISSCILGLAVSSMHFIAMRATYFYNPDILLNTAHNHELHIGLISTIGVIIIGLIGLILFGSLIDRQISKMAYSLIESEELFKQFSETTQTAIFTFNEDHIIYCNSVLKEITGFYNHEIYTKPIEIILGEEFKQISKKLFDVNHLLKTPYNTQYKISSHNNNKTSWLYITINSTKIDNEIMGIASAVDITKQKESELNMQKLAYSDQLTNSPNRRSFIKYLENRIHDIRFSDEINTCYVLLIDMDNFKSVNDSYGHQHGDLLIKEVSKRLNKIRSEKSFAARLGGDEFIILIEEEDNIEILADNFVSELSKPYLIEDKHMQLNCSMGIYQLNSDIIQYDQILNNVDIALFRAKKEYKSKWILFDENLDAKSKRQRQLQPELKNAIKNNKLELFYQPIVDAKNYKLLGFESLSRWHRNNNEWVSPDEFIPIAEKSGLIEDISLWALETACKQIDYFNQTNVNDKFYISVNISSSCFYDEHFYKKIIELFNQYDIKKRQLRIEITERMLVKYSEELILKLNSLIGIGCELMIDDFGTGYSSLSYLHILPISTIKIDRSFILSLDNNHNTETIINTIITLAQSLNMTIISEGIETLNQAIKLQKLGSDALQGYYFSKPMPIDKVIKYLEEQNLTFSTDNNFPENQKIHKEYI